MNTVRDYLHQLVNEISVNEIPEVVDFLEYLKSKKIKEQFSDLENASQSSMKFWDNDIDDEVWNDV